jgi:hypothetical protein
VDGAISSDISNDPGGSDVPAVVHLTRESSVDGDIALTQGEIALRRRDTRLAQLYAEVVSSSFARTLKLMS